MNLDEHQIDTIRATFLTLSADTRRAGDVFYKHLFGIAPDTRNLFVTDIELQGAKLMSTLALVVSQLQTWRDLEPVLEDLALRHLAYGVRRHHYQAVGAALQATLRDILQAAFTPEAETAWARAYDALADTMTAMAYPEPA